TTPGPVLGPRGGTRRRTRNPHSRRRRRPGRRRCREPATRAGERAGPHGHRGNRDRARGADRATDRIGRCTRMTPTTSPRRPRRILTLLIALVVPLLVAAAFTTTLPHPGRRAEQAVASAVNNDEPVALDGQTDPPGRRLAHARAAGKGRPQAAL